MSEVLRFEMLPWYQMPILIYTSDQRTNHDSVSLSQYFVHNKVLMLILDHVLTSQ